MEAQNHITLASNALSTLALRSPTPGRAPQGIRDGGIEAQNGKTLAFNALEDLGPSCTYRQVEFRISRQRRHGGTELQVSGLQCLQGSLLFAHQYLVGSSGMLLRTHRGAEPQDSGLHCLQGLLPLRCHSVQQLQGTLSRILKCAEDRSEPQLQGLPRLILKRRHLNLLGPRVVFLC